MTKKNNQPIGVLDSGIGGLTIWKEIVNLLPHESTVYIADSKNCPYGSRPREEIYRLVRRLVQFLLEKQCKLIVLACNTITVSCLDTLRDEFPKVPIVGAVPVVKTAAEQTKNCKIGILSTTRTAKSKYQKDLIERFAGNCEVINFGTNKLVPLIEEGENNTSIIRIIEVKIQPFKDAGVDVLALGCSHFPLIRDQIQKILGSKVLVLDSGEAIARQVKRVLQGRIQRANLSNKPWHEFYTTGKTERFSEILASIGYNKPVRKIDL